MAFKNYKMTFGGAEYVLNSDDGGQSGSVFRPEDDMNRVSYGYLWAASGDHGPRVSRWGDCIAQGDEIVVDYDSGVPGKDHSSWSDDDSIAEILENAPDSEAAFAIQMARLVGLMRDAGISVDDQLGEGEDCGECPACLANAERDNAVRGQN
jgi:hypothetical protein